MELLTIEEAKEKAGVSDKTLRRAIESGALKVQAKLHSNSKIMISSAALDAYIASRQPVSNDVQAPVQTEIITAMQQQIESLVQRVQALESLERRIAELEKMMLSLAPVPTSDNTLGHDDQTVSKRTGTRAKKQDEPVFKIANFSIGYQKEYESRVSKGDVYAALTVSPYTDELRENEPDIYSIYRFDWHPMKKTPNPSDAMRSRGIELKEKLYKAVIDDMLSHGWVVVREDNAGKVIYRKADT